MKKLQSGQRVKTLRPGASYKEGATGEVAWVIPGCLPIVNFDPGMCTTGSGLEAVPSADLEKLEMCTPKAARSPLWKYQVGDRIKIIKPADGPAASIMGGAGTIKAQPLEGSDHYRVELDNRYGVTFSFHSSQMEPLMKEQHDINSDIILANKGMEAIVRLMGKGGLQWKQRGSSSWHDGGVGLATLIEYRLKPKLVFGTLYVLDTKNPTGSHPVNLIDDGKTLKIGCKTFPVENALTILRAFCRDKIPFLGSEYVATREGIRDSRMSEDYHQISWDDADHILVQLEKAGF